MVDANTGQPVAKNDYYKSGHFSRDGRYLLSSSNFSGALFDSETVPKFFRSNSVEPRVPQTITGSPTAIDNTGFAMTKAVGSPAKAVDMDLRPSSLSRHTQTMVGDKLLTVATHYVQSVSTI